MISQLARTIECEQEAFAKARELRNVEVEISKQQVNHLNAEFLRSGSTILHHVSDQIIMKPKQIGT
jgi:hypothetical protein